MTKFELGDHVRHVVTGETGIVVAPDLFYVPPNCTPMIYDVDCLTRQVWYTPDEKLEKLDDS